MLEKDTLWITEDCVLTNIMRLKLNTSFVTESLKADIKVSEKPLSGSQSHWSSSKWNHKDTDGRTTCCDN